MKKFTFLKNAMHGLAIKSMLLVVFLLGIGTSDAFAEKKPYAVFDNATKTLTFKYGEKETLGTNEYWLDGAKWSSSGMIKAVFDASFADARPTTCRNWFYYCTQLASIEGIEYLNTEEVTDMSYMFYECKNLKNLNLSYFNTKSVTNMSNMFKECEALESLDLSNFETENVTNMESMFDNCTQLKTLTLSDKFNTQKVTSMRTMFYFCANIKSLNLSGFDTKEVTTMREMFKNCKSLTSLDLSKFNTQKVEDMIGVFSCCYGLTSLDLSNFDTQKVTNMGSMFYYCTGLKTIDISNFNTKIVTNMSNMFYYCQNLTTIYVGNDFVVNEKTTGSDMFGNCSKLIGSASNNTGKEYANYHNGYFKKYIGTLGTEKLGATGTEPNLEVKNLNFTDYKNLELNVGESFIATSSNYIRKDIKNQWGTLYLPFETNLKDKNIRAFELLNVNDDAIELKEIEGNVKAWTPVFIKMNEGTTELNLASIDNSTKSVEAESATANSQYQLKGTTEMKAFTSTDTNCFILKGDKLMNPAKILEKNSTTAVGILPYHVYMEANSSETNPAQVFSIRVGGDATAIEELNEAMNDGKAEYYNLQGHRLNNLQKGVNIIKRGNKTIKVIIK